METQKDCRNIGLDCVRGLSMLYIVGFWHLKEYIPFSSWKIIYVSHRITYVVLASFVLLSGYFIGRKGNPLTWPAISKFYKSRFFRIYPLYLLALILFIPLHLCETGTALKAALGVSMVIGPAPMTLWFVTMLIIFYILAPFIQNSIERKHEMSIVMAYIAVSAVLIVYDRITDLLDIRMLIYFPSFFLGMLLGRNRLPSITKPSWLIGALLISIALSLIPIDDKQLGKFIFLPIATVGALAVFVYARRITICSSFLRNTSLSLAYSSYTMYLLHRVVYTSLSAFYLPKTTSTQLLYYTLLGIPCCFAISCLAQSSYDRLLKRCLPR